jgi:hypothetical protein
MRGASVRERNYTQRLTIAESTNHLRRQADQSRHAEIISIAQARQLLGTNHSSIRIAPRFVYSRLHLTQTWLEQSIVASGGESRRGMEGGPGPRTAKRRLFSAFCSRPRALALNQTHHRVRKSADSCRQKLGRLGYEAQVRKSQNTRRKYPAALRLGPAAAACFALERFRTIAPVAPYRFISSTV